jgi:eukaryotic-like serine/threonine-protein kinase
MALTPGARVGPYEITASVGAGGMGEVYRARDTRLKRDVAVKVLPESFAADTERVARFAREAEMLAALNHPNIAAIYGVEEMAPSTGAGHAARALVMELVEGETLADRTGRGPIPVEEALAIATQIAEALEAAHERGVIHRDLKPANVKVRDDGTVKVLDFGLAKLADPPAAATAHAMPASMSPTITSPALATHAGVLLGTAAYMSPEQAKGRPADKRSDIWAFGCVLYEMLTGRAAFAAPTVTEMLAAVLRGDPDWGALPQETPSGVRRLLRRALQKDDRLRLRDIGDARLEIGDPDREHGEPTAPVPRGRSLRAGIALAVTAVAASGLTAIVAMRVLAPSPSTWDITTPAVSSGGLGMASFAISPDGQQVVFVADDGRRSRLWVKGRDRLEATAIDGTEDALLPFWSPDGRFVAFFVGGALKRVDLSSGSVQEIASVSASPGTGGSWNGDGTIVFSASALSDQPVWRVSARGGEPAPVGTPGLRGTAAFPQFLPDGQHFLFLMSGEDTGVHVGHVDGRRPKRVIGDADSRAVYSPRHRRLFFLRDGALVGASFDTAALEVDEDDEIRVVDGVLSAFGLGAFSISATGDIVYRSGDALRQFVEVDRNGQEIRRVGEPVGDSMTHPSLSGDGRTVAMQRGTTDIDIWLLDLERGIPTHLVRNTGLDVGPVFSPDDRTIIFASDRAGRGADLYRVSVTRPGPPERVLGMPGPQSVLDWGSGWLLFRSTSEKTGLDLFALPVGNDGVATGDPVVVAEGDGAQHHGEFSPDGDYVAYVSDETGRYQVYVTSFPPAGRPIPISRNGGAQARWGAGGSELFYLSLDNRLMRVPLARDPVTNQLKPGEPVEMFEARIGSAVSGMSRQEYIVMGEGQRFLLNEIVAGAPAPLRVLLDWID